MTHITCIDQQSILFSKRIQVYCVVLMLFFVPYFVLNKVIFLHYLQDTEYHHWHYQCMYRRAIFGITVSGKPLMVDIWRF